MAKDSILVVEDDEDILELVQYNLIKAGYRSAGVTTGGEALRVARSMLPDLLILDLMLPGLDGIEVCTMLKNDTKTRDIPIIMLTAKGEERDVVRGLDCGADDYVTKPFSPRILVARVKAVLRSRAIHEPADAPLRVHTLLIHPGRREVSIDGRFVELTNMEFRVLHCLAQRPGWVFTRSRIVDVVRGEGYPVTDRAVDVQIVGLRRKLGEQADLIETVRGVGYRLKE